MLAATQFIFLTADETSTVDNLSYIVIHVYLLQDWMRVPIILHINKLESGDVFYVLFSTSMLWSDHV
jgi:hypothetical protein